MEAVAPDTSATSSSPVWRLRISPRTLEVTPEILERVIAQIVERLRTRPAGTLPGFLVYAPRTPRSALFRPKDRSSHSESGAKVCSLT